MDYDIDVVNEYDEERKNKIAEPQGYLKSTFALIAGKKVP